MSYPYGRRSPLEGIMQGLQIRSMIDDIKARREARAQQAQLHQLEIQRYQNEENRRNFATALTLSQMGAIPSSPGQEQAMQGLTEQLGPPTPESARVPIEAPFGNSTRTYRLPSQLDKYALAQKQAQQEGSLEAIKQTAFQAGTAEAGIPVKYPAIGDQPSVTVNVPKSQYATAIKTLRELQGGDYAAHEFRPDDQGNVTFTGIPKGGGPPTILKLGQYGTTKPPKEMSDAEQRARALVRARARLAQEFPGPKLQDIQNSYAGGLYQTYAQQEGIDWKYEQDAARDSDKARHIAQVRARAQQDARAIVERDLKAKEEQYTDEELAGGGTGATGATKAPAKPAGKVPVLKAANVAEAARRKGMTVEQFKQWFASQGGVIQ